MAIVAGGALVFGLSQHANETDAATRTAATERTATEAPSSAPSATTTTPVPTTAPPSASPSARPSVVSGRITARPSASATATPAPAAAAASSSTASTTSTSMPRGDVTSNGRTWKQTYAEDFTTDAGLGSVLDTYPRLGAYSGYSDTSGRGYYAPDKVLSVSNGNLDFWLHSEGGQPLVATVLPDDYAPHTTGRVSIRYKTTNTDGYKFVGMLWPSSNDWNEGEIDWPEGDLGSTVRPASAIPGSMSDGVMTFDSSIEQHTTSTQSSGYHVATTEWDHGEVRFFWDGTLVSTTRSAVPTTPMRVTLQAETAIGGSVPTSASGHVDVDWVSIWD
ncbi:glycoside hydrolase family 16 protein [Curtobacterium sp. A7_M15]|uniref:glycoside hydrolase family 16 protein n=1 Tax=Curtobacterium sp. A7_M15 TaxID=3065241 RepID=UPI002737FFD3|nr:glycoside hydrolase family 16 protein [Curtobacterium sp. A7_M15]MDP4332725.1 glycoside hydrolase family 16 protein [Curtobacterium sp. A7_M15]